MTLKTLKEQALSDLDIIFDTNLPGVETVTYADNPIPAVLDFGEDLDRDSGSVMARATIMVRVPDVPDPGYRDVVTIQGRPWRVEVVRAGDGNTWLLDLYREERPVLL